MGNPPELDRGQRRRQRTRLRLLHAAEEVMAHKGMDAATIQEITNAADVGFGTFYNHFASKDAILEALLEETVERWGQALDQIVECCDDSAAILAAAIRFSLHRAEADRTWGWFLYRIGPSMLRQQYGLVKRIYRRIEKGVEVGRFNTDDVEMAVVAIVGALLATIAAILHKEVSDDAPERIAAQCLIMLGVPTAEAGQVARQPLPDIELPELG